MTKYDYIMSSDNPRFKNQIKKILNIPEEKFLSCDFGSEMIDELCNTTITKVEAKEHFGIGSKYVIVCGYNGGVAQNHLKIIHAIGCIRNRLPEELIVVLPMTYNTSVPYLGKVQQALKENQLENIILTDYLSNSAKREFLEMNSGTTCFISLTIAGMSTCLPSSSRRSSASRASL